MNLNVPGDAELIINPEHLGILEGFKGRKKDGKKGVTYGVVFAIARQGKKAVKMTRFFDYMADAEDFRNLVKDVRGRVYTGIIEEGE